ncbi:MAG: tRNA (5-methylaminomethyl-2-thiouridine)(34)-methyltransferase MnmD [Bacteroidales bacterium]|nr:tRNA (5-methylaminomethyl-2-thiouridine)(34)-methyltransferase MnmD [Bacteroidales bacterium]
MNKHNPGIELQLSDDGSHTLFVPELDEHYHSTRGAVQEALYVYIERGVRACKKNPCTVVEIGFGTGLNALLTAIDAIETNRSVQYVSYEKFPLLPDIVARLNYARFVVPQYAALFEQIHCAEWNEIVEIVPQFTLHKVQGDITLLPALVPCNVIYFDAFAPNKQAEMWSQTVLHHVCAYLQPGGIFVTYCAQGHVRRTLKSIGLQVERLPGPPGKWEMLRGTK